MARQVVAGAIVAGYPLATVLVIVVAGAVIAHEASVLEMIRSATSRSAPLNVVAWYYVAAAALARGYARRPARGGTAASPGLKSALVIAHAQLKLLGWLRLAIIGT